MDRDRGVRCPKWRNHLLLIPWRSVHHQRAVAPAVLNYRLSGSDRPIHRNVQQTMDQVDRSCGRLGLLRVIGSGAGFWLCSQITAEPKEGQGQRLTAKAAPRSVHASTQTAPGAVCSTRSPPCESPADDPSRGRDLHGPGTPGTIDVRDRVLVLGELPLLTGGTVRSCVDVAPS